MHSKDLSDVIFVPLVVEGTRKKQSVHERQRKTVSEGEEMTLWAGGGGGWGLGCGQGQGQGGGLGSWQRCTKEQKKQKKKQQYIRILATNAQLLTSQPLQVWALPFTFILFVYFFFLPLNLCLPFTSLRLKHCLGEELATRSQLPAPQRGTRWPHFEPLTCINCCLFWITLESPVILDIWVLKKDPIFISHVLRISHRMPKNKFLQPALTCLGDHLWCTLKFRRTV